jgi:hypothetical protein
MSKVAFVLLFQFLGHVKLLLFVFNVLHLIIIIIINVITFMHSIYNYITETNHVARLCNVAAVQYV